MSKVVKTRRSGKRSVARVGPTPTRHLNQVTSHEVLVPNRREVLAYCRAHPFLARELPRIAARARAFFGTDAELLPVLYRDPEIDDRYLTMYVRTDPLEPDLMDRIEELNCGFHESWNPAWGYLLLTTDYRKPQTRHGV